MERRSQRTVQPVRRRLVDDVRPRAAAAQHTSTQTVVTAAERELGTLRQHVGRMLQTAGHSWGAGEHDILLAPLHKLQAFKHRMAPARMQRWQVAYFAMLVAALLAIPVSIMVSNARQAQRYELSAATQKLVDEPIVALDKQLSFDAKNGLYRYNPGAVNGVQPAIDSAGDNEVQLGGSNYYGVSLAADASKGQSFTDATTKLSFSLTPLFSQLNGKHEDGHVVYPLDGGQVVYTLKDNGLKEDVVLSTPTDNLSLNYKLQLPAELTARLLSDGSVGIYSADPGLYGSTGNGSNQALLEKARLNSVKNNLVFQLPAPQIVQSGHTVGNSHVSFSLTGDVLKVTASNLRNLSYPISIDPSVVVSTANSFTAGNNEDSSMIISSGSLVRGGITGGTISAGWGSTGSSTFTTPRDAFGTAVYNGFVYVVGGNKSGSIGATDVSFAQIGSSGTLTGWADTTALGTGVSDNTAVAYNGYLYNIGGDLQGGVVDSTAVEFALICTGPNSNIAAGCGSSAVAGSVGSWASTTNLTTGVYNQASVVYDGYMYVLGGCVATGGSGRASCPNSGGFTNTVLMAKINADGTVGNWSSSTAAWSKRFFLEAVAYNGYIYIGGGCTSVSIGVCTGSADDIWYAPINSDGTLGTWVATSSFSDPTGTGPGRQAFGMMAYKGYMYVAEGCKGGASCNPNAGVIDTQYAPIYANGTLGAWTTTTAPSAERYEMGAFAANGYLFMVGGCIGSSGNCGGGLDNGGVSAPIDAFNAGSAPSGTTGTWTSGSSLVGGTGVFNATSATYDGYIYTVGGCTTTTCSSVNASVQFAAVCTGGNTTSIFTTNCDTTKAPGTMSSWKAASTMGSARYGLGVFAYHGYLFAVGGCSSGSATSCTGGSYLNTVESAPINSDGSLGSWSSAGTFDTNGRWGIGVAMYNGYAYVTGGQDSTATVVGTTRYAPIGTSGGFGTWASATTAGTLPVLFASSSVAYNSYLYMMGGETSPGSFSGIPTAAKYALLKSDGSLSSNSCGTSVTWCTGAGSFPTAVTGANAQAYDGVMYLIGGATSGSAQNIVQYAPINASAVLGTWATASPNFTNNRKYPSPAIVNGYLYIIGGINASPDSTTQYATLQTFARVAHYSRLIDFFSGATATNSDEQFTRYALNCTSSCTNMGSTAGLLQVSTNGAPTTWSTVSSTLGAPLGANASFTKVSGRYGLLFLSIDDSQTATFADTAPTTVQTLNIFFHANAARRLREGQTFTNLGISGGTNNQLDTEGP